MNEQEWVLRRNCSITPRQLVLVYAALCFVSLAIAMIFAVRGAWVILGFALVEMSALRWAGRLSCMPVTRPIVSTSPCVTAVC